MHVGLGVIAGVVGGPATYGLKLARAVAALGADAPRLTVLTDEPARFESALRDQPVEVVHLPMRGGFDRLRWQYLALPAAIRRLRLDVYHDAKNALPRGLRCPGVVTIHDLAYHVVPESFGWMSRLFLRRATGDAARRAARIVVPSEATAADVRRVHPEARAKLVIAPHGIDRPEPVDPEHLASVRARLQLPERYVLHVGTIQKRKNVDLVVAGVRALRTQGFPDLRTVVVGRKGWLAERAIAQIESDDTALLLGQIAASDLRAVYAGASVFCSPSAYEGFGFTVADALAYGVPAVISDVSSLPEVCAHAAVRLRDLTADAVADGIRTVLEDEALAARLAEAGRHRAATFTWERAARIHVEAWHAAAGRGDSAAG